MELKGYAWTPGIACPCWYISCQGSGGRPPCRDERVVRRLGVSVTAVNFRQLLVEREEVPEYAQTEQARAEKV